MVAHRERKGLRGAVRTTAQGAAIAGKPPGLLETVTALVTGGGRGLGAAISARLADAGARVAITGRNEDSLTTWAASLPNEPVTIAADLADPEAAAEVLHRTIAELGRVDVVVNNAGVGHFGASDGLTPAVVDSIFPINVRAPLLLAGATQSSRTGRPWRPCCATTSNRVCRNGHSPSRRSSCRTSPPHDAVVVLGRRSSTM